LHRQALIIFISVALGCLEVIAVTVCWYMTFRAYRSMKAEKEMRR